MNPILLPIYGPVSIQAWGFMIVLGLLITTYLMRRDPSKDMTDDQLYTLITGCIIWGVIGCRLLYIVTTPDMTLWDRVFSLSGGAILGGIIADILFIVWYAKHIGKPAFKVLDFVGLYTPFLYSFGRIGCFFAGCCYGAPTTIAWAVTYTHPESAAPLCVALHPSQLYSSASLAVIFIFLYWIRPRLSHSGQLISLSVFLMSMERFVNDFFREEHGSGLISQMQWLALGMAVLSAIMFVAVSCKRR